MLSGILVIALPITVVGSNFSIYAKLGSRQRHDAKSTARRTRWRRSDTRDVARLADEIPRAPLAQQPRADVGHRPAAHRAPTVYTRAEEEGGGETDVAFARG